MACVGISVGVGQGVGVAVGVIRPASERGVASGVTVGLGGTVGAGAAVGAGLGVAGGFGIRVGSGAASRVGTGSGVGGCVGSARSCTTALVSSWSLLRSHPIVRTVAKANETRRNTVNFTLLAPHFDARCQISVRTPQSYRLALTELNPIHRQKSAKNKTAPAIRRRSIY